MSDDEKNLEAGTPERIQGYDRLGRLMGELPEMAMFRRFGALSAEDLLYRQAELVHLEESLRKYQRMDRESQHQDRQRYALDWYTLQSSRDDDAPEGNDSSQLDTILEIREKLKDYHEALLRHRKVVELGTPLPWQMRALKKWMKRPSMGNVFLEGLDRHIWDEPDMDDMVTLTPPSPESKFTTNLTVGLIHAYNAVLGRRIHKPGAKDYMRNTIRYTDKGTFRVLKTLCTIIACLLPVGAIAVLYVIDTMPARLGAVAGFTALFAFSLSLVTSATVHNIFAATTAFAAVLVVFVGTADSAHR